MSSKCVDAFVLLGIPSLATQATLSHSSLSLHVSKAPVGFVKDCVSCDCSKHSNSVFQDIFIYLLFAFWRLSAYWGGLLILTRLNITVA